MKYKKKMFFTEKQMEVLRGEAIMNTLYSLLVDTPEDFNYHEEAIKQLIRKFTLEEEQ